MQLVERHVINPADPRFAPIDRAAFASKNLYNAANYVVRQSFIHEGVYRNYHEMHRRMKEHKAYQALPAKVAQWALRLLDKNWESFFAAMAAWRKDPSTFLGRPKLPGYKDKQQGRNLLVYTTQALSAPALRDGLIVPSMLAITIKTKQQEVQQVRIIPRKGFYVVEVIYDREPLSAAVDPALHAGVDIGLNNLATITADKPCREGHPHRVPGCAKLRPSGQGSCHSTDSRSTGYFVFFCHLQNEAILRALAPDQAVATATALGVMGDTGNAQGTPQPHAEIHYPAGNSFTCTHCTPNKTVTSIDPYNSLVNATKR